MNISREYSLDQVQHLAYDTLVWPGAPFTDMF